MPKPKRPRIETARQAEDRLKKGKGNHLAADYEPYITIHDFSSVGRVSRTVHAGRLIHTMSDLETGFLRELQWAGAIEIFDQVALADFNRCSVDETVAIANQIGVDHPRHKRDQSPSVMTTDLVAKYVVPGNPPSLKLHAFAVKPTSAVTINREASPSAQQEAKRTIEKLEIERRFWAKRRIGWSLVTSDDVDQTRKRNIEFFQSATRPGWMPDAYGLEDEVTKLLREAHPSTRLADLKPASRKLAEHLSKPRDMVECLKWLVSTRKLEFDLSKPFGPDCRVRDFDLGKALN